MRNQLLNISEIDKWFSLSNFNIGVNFKGEYTMGGEWCKVIITDQSNNEYINFGDLKFSNINRPDNFFLVTDDQRYIFFQWMFFKTHPHSTPILINLETKAFQIIDSVRLLKVMKFWLKENELFAQFRETKWLNSKLYEIYVIEKINSNNMLPLQHFFDLDEDSIKVQIFKWIDENNLQITIE